ncbi:MAG: hypothetical protein IPO07_13895 [Haliscomenobacter sp.]|nr:hypothetical protein [Haliscomenobacter sp.]MBK9489745.1 hypothetical protein [Haliscomenobacter sp.]
MERKRAAGADPTITRCIMNPAGHHGLHSANGRGLAAWSAAHVRIAIIAKTGDGFSGHCIDGLERVVEVKIRRLSFLSLLSQ